MEKSSPPHDDDHQDSTSENDQEVDQDEVGMGRSYECVFCKRGFTTAQALGGHMNIHRKDRAKNRPTLIHSNNKLHGHDFYPPGQHVGDHHHHHHHHHQVSYQTYFPPSTSSVARPPPSYSYANPQFGEDWRVRLSLQFGAAREGHHHEEKKRGGSEEGELDLELRLGSYNN